MSSTAPSKSSSKYVEYDEFVDYQLEKTRSEIKWNDVLTTMAGIAALTLAYLFVFTMLDHWVIDGGFTRLTRALLLFSLVIVSVGWVIWKIVIPWWRKVHALFAARMIEEHVPELKSNLLNLIDLEAAGHKPNPSILKAMEKRSAVELSKVDMENVIDRRQLLRICIILLGVVVLFCLYALFSPKPISFLRPLTIANVPVATQTRIVEVKPGDISVLARRSLPVTVTLRDKIPDRVLFHYTTDDESFVNEQLEMQLNEEKEGEYLLMFAGENGEGIGQKTTYYVTAGDARSETFTIEVQQVPTATIERIEYRYPDYMELEPRSQFIGAIDAWEGTEVFLDARIGNDVPVKSAVVQFVDSGQSSTGYEEVPLTVIDGNRLQGSWKLEFRNDGTYAREYRILCKSEAGVSEDDPPAYPILIRPDTAPEVGFVDPSGDIERPANAVVPLVYKARDPDFQLRYVTLRVEKDGEELQSYQLFEGQQKAVADRFRWDLNSLRLQPGDIVSFALEARDNKQPFGNRRSSQPLKLTITAPAEPEALEEQLRKEEAEQEPQLKDEQQDAAEQNGEEGGEESGDNTSEEGTEETEANNSKDNKSGQPKGDQPNDQNSDPQNKQPADEPQEGDNPTPEGQPEAEPSDTDGMNDESEMPETLEENGKQDGEPNTLKNDGTDDAEALEKIIKDQKEKGDQASGSGESGEEQTGEEGGSGAEMPDDKASYDPAQPGTGNGANKKTEKPDDPKNPGNKGDAPANDGTGEESEGSGDEKRPGDPNAKGTGTPEENADPKNSTKTNDPDNIKRKDGTDPSTAPSEDPQSSDNPKKENTDQPSDRPPNAGEEKGNPNSPGAKTQPDGPDRLDPADGDPKGQRSKKPDSGETGSSQQASDGQKGGTEKGNGESTDKPGHTEENPEGKPGGKPGEPMSDQKQSGEGKPGGEKSSGGEGKGESSGKGAGSGEGKENPKGELEEGSAGGSGKQPGTNGGGAGSSEAGSSSGTSSPGTSEEQNLDHAKQAADLVLKRLEQQLERGEVSDELLKELGWSEGQMRAFADRMRHQLAQNREELTSEEQIRQRQFEEMLKNMNFQPKEETSQSNNSQPGRATRSFGSRNIPVPIEYRDAYESFTRELGRKK
jgi:hypothetical protein